MSLPRSHVESLERHVRLHEDRIKLLREHLRDTPSASDPNPKGDPNPKPALPLKRGGYRDLLDREIRFHEKVIGLARNPRALKALEDLMTNQDFVRDAARDPRGAAQEREIDLPAAIALNLGLENDNVVLRISSYEGLSPFMVTWDSKHGFSPPADPELAKNEFRSRL